MSWDTGLRSGAIMLALAALFVPGVAEAASAAGVAAQGAQPALSLTTDLDSSFCAVLRNGEVECWGHNLDGALGNGGRQTSSFVPVKVTGLSGVVSLASDDEDAVLIVADDGPGISGELLPRIFDAYMTTRPGGSGVGLALVRDIAMRAGGTVRARSSEGEGSRFEVRLPRVREAVAQA